MSDLKFPDDRMYHKNHLWAKKEADGNVRVGISDYAQNQLDNVIFIDLPTAGAHFQQGLSGAELESVKTTSPAIMPVSGTVATVNTKLDDAPELVNSSPYEDGWLMLVKPDDLNEGGLLTAGEYKKLLGI